MADVKAVTNDDFEKTVLSTETPIVVDFWAPWCGWCKRLAPMLEEMADQYEGKLTIVKVNVDEEQELAQRFGISSLPTLKYFCEGREVGEHIGAAPKPRLEAAFDDLVKNHKECLASSSAMKKD